MSTSGGGRPNLRRVSIDGYPMPGFFPLRPLRIGEIFGAATRITFRNFGSLFPLALVINLFTAVIQIALLAAFGVLDHVARNDYLPTSGTLTDAQANEAFRVLGLVGLATLISLAVSFLGTVVLSAVSVTAATDGALTETATKPFRRLKGRYGAALGAAALTALAVLGGLILLIIPGIILAFALFVGTPVAVIEGQGPRASLRRSAQLTKGFRPRIFGIQILAGLISSGIGLVIGAVGGSLFGLSGAYSSTAGYVTFQLVISALLSVFNCWSATVNGLIYVDLRMRKEDLGRTLWSHAVSQAPPEL